MGLYRDAILLSVGRMDEAREAIERTLSHSPDHSGALALRSVMGVMVNDRESALRDARRAVELEVPESVGIAQRRLVGIGARQGRLHHHEPLGLLRVAAGEGVGDHHADVVPDHRPGGEPQGVRPAREDRADRGAAGTDADEAQVGVRSEKRRRLSFHTLS